MTTEICEQLNQLLSNWSREGQRVLLLARRVIPEADIDDADIDSPELSESLISLSDLVAVGMIAIVDPPRPEIREVIRACRSGGIRVVMITGDYGKTAEAIARDVGIITAPRGPLPSIQHLRRDVSELHQVQSLEQSTIIIGGPQLSFLNDVQWDQLCAYKEIVFARTSPEQKIQIVREFKARNYAVAMTGDGINDAPSLKAADIGITLSSGSDIAIEAADVVLLDSFSAIIVAVEYGRLLADNLKKIIIYQLPAGLFSELCAVLLNIFLGLPLILSRFLMIVISILTDCAVATSFIFEKPEMDLLSRPPRNLKTDRIVNLRLLIYGFLFIGFLECVPAMAMAFWYLQREGVPFSILLFSFGSYPSQYNEGYITARLNTASSIYFVNLVIMQLFNGLGMRTRRASILQQVPIIRKKTKNVPLFVAMLFALGVVFFFCYIPWFQVVIGTTKVPFEYYLFPIGFGMAILLIEELRKFICRKYPKSIVAKVAW